MQQTMFMQEIWLYLSSSFPACGNCNGFSCSNAPEQQDYLEEEERSLMKDKTGLRTRTSSSFYFIIINI